MKKKIKKAESIQSEPYNLNTRDYKAVIRTGLIFLIPMALMYLAQVTNTLQLEGHVFSLKDFIPTPFTLGGMSLYALNRITDLIRKYLA